MESSVGKYYATNENLQFKAWLCQQISSGKYKDLEWIDADKKRVFKLPWTKKNYPDWEEHHKIFQAWAHYRSEIKCDPKPSMQHISLMKSNFRTILRKCSEIEELKNFHQLSLQTGNYKVYKVLTEEEAKTKRAIPKLKQYIEVEEDSANDIIEISSNVGINGIQWLPKSNIPDDWIAATSSLGMVVLEAEQPSMKRPFSISPKLSPKPKVKRTQSTQTAVKDPLFNAKEVVFLSEPELEENEAGTEIIVPFNEFSDDVPFTIVEVGDVESEDIEQSENTEGFNMLLEAAEITSDSAFDNPNENSCEVFQNPSIIDVMDKLHIPQEQLHTYDVQMKYGTQEIWSEVYCEMDKGYRIHNDGKKYESRQNWPFVSMKLPSPSVYMGKPFDIVLQNMDAGLILRTDKSFNLVAKRLCQSQVYATTSYSNFNTSETLQLKKDDEIVLFSYSCFLQAWFFALKHNKTTPKIEVHISFGKKPKLETSKTFITLRLIPSAAASILDFVAPMPNTTAISSNSSSKAANDKQSYETKSLKQIMEMFN